jgi:hypothetical protein
MNKKPCGRKPLQSCLSAIIRDEMYEATKNISPKQLKRFLNSARPNLTKVNVNLRYGSK